MVGVPPATGVFIAMHSLTIPALWFALAMGALLDLTGPTASDHGGTVVSLGPMALAYLAAAYTIVQVRGAVVRRNPISLVALTILASLVASVVAVPLLCFRSLYADPTGFSLAGELMRRLTASVYTGVPALILAWPLTHWVRIFGFQDLTARRYARRA